MNYAVGSLVRVRERDWVVQPGSTDQLLKLRPLDGSDLEFIGVLTALEQVQPASFPLPDTSHPGDLRSARLLRDAVRIGFRSSAGPLRCLARIAVTPRSYQLVPLLMALRQDTVRLLIADDVGIGKTIEAGLIASELMARGEINGLCVLCSPQLADQWRRELDEKFHLNPQLVLSSTVSALERGLQQGESLFERYPVTVVSIDYIKSDRRRQDFLRACPDLVIVDEAHTCARAGRQMQHQRYELLQRLAENRHRGLVLVTATPHSGNEEAFRSLLGLLDPELEALPEDLSGEHNRPLREKLARYMVLRLRGDIIHQFNEEALFPKRLESDAHWTITTEYRKLVEQAMRYASEWVNIQGGTKQQRRIRLWAAISMMRCIISSPAAAVETLRARARTVGEQPDAGRDTLLEDADLQQLERQLYDLVDDQFDTDDVAPNLEQAEEALNATEIRRLQEMARAAEKLKGEKDTKLQRLISLTRQQLQDGYHPILFCRYIPTAEYVAEHLGKALNDAEVSCVTGKLPHDEREQRVQALAEHPKRVLVCTDCLSEGINLQEWFDAVIHVDLAWSPTRHEQRNGRIDRFGQQRREVRTVMVYGDNPIDGRVLKVLLQKHKTIRNTLGVSYAVPVDSEHVLEAIFEDLFASGNQDWTQLTLFDDLEQKTDAQWREAEERMKRVRSVYTQQAMKPDELKPLLQEMQDALGDASDVERFIRDAVTLLGGAVTDHTPALINLTHAPVELRLQTGFDKPFNAVFSLPGHEGAVTLNRTHPWTETLAQFVMDQALAGAPDAPAKRCGVTRTDAVEKPTVLLLLLLRFLIQTGSSAMLAEAVALTGYTGHGTSRVWLEDADLRPLLDARPTGNVGADNARQMLSNVINRLDTLQDDLLRVAAAHADRLQRAHDGLRSAYGSRQPRPASRVQLQGAPGLLGVYVLIP